MSFELDDTLSRTIIVLKLYDYHTLIVRLSCTIIGGELYDYRT